MHKNSRFHAMSSGVWSFITFHSSNINIKAPLNVWNPWFNVAIAVLILGTRNIKLFIQTHNTETDIISSNENIYSHEYFLLMVKSQFVDIFSLLNMRLFYCPLISLVTLLSGNSPWVSVRQAREALELVDVRLCLVKWSERLGALMTVR